MSEPTLSWRAIAAKSTVVTTDGVEVGHVTEVAALPNEDIFHGVVFHHHRLGRMVLAPAADVGLITETVVNLTVDAEAVSKFEEFHALEIERLSLKGAFHWKHMGWKNSDE